MADPSVDTPNTYKHLIITDPSQPVWVAPVDSYEMGIERAGVNFSNGRYIILVGPTGSGKSSFIEAIASKSTREPLGIAKDQLDSVTQQPCIYEIKNLEVTDNSYIYLIDTPGFADPRISELQVFDKLTFWRDKCQNVGYARILYFHPIGDIRMPASRRRCLAMTKNFWGIRESPRAMLVTSMWDRVPGWSRGAAEKRFAQLSSNHWGDWITEGSVAVKFENTFESALSIIDLMCEYKASRDDHPIVHGLGGEGTSGSPVHEALFDRISHLEQKRDMLREDLARPDTEGQAELLNILTNDLTKTELLLQQFRPQMEDLLKRVCPCENSPVSNPMDVFGRHSSVTAPDGNNKDPDFSTGQPKHDHSDVLSLPKRFSKWVDKKIDKMHLGGSSRKRGSFVDMAQRIKRPLAAPSGLRTI